MIFALVAVTVAALWHVRTTNRLTTAHIDRLTEAQATHTRHLQRVIAQKNPDLEQLIALIDRQMQRIQAPTQAVVDHSMASVQIPTPPAVSFDDDEGYWASKDELAEVEMAAELAAR